MRYSADDINRKHLSIFKIGWDPETPIKDAIKFSLISLAAISITALSLYAFLEVFL